jgi:hypothetical protein
MRSAAADIEPPLPPVGATLWCQRVRVSPTGHNWGANGKAGRGRPFCIAGGYD